MNAAADALASPSTGGGIDRRAASFHAIVLAAGASRRFGDGHKALAGVDGDRGTLLLALETLSARADCSGTTVVTGAFADAVEAQVRGRSDGTRLVHNFEADVRGPLHSLVVGLAGLESEPVWVFHADTYYAADFLACLTADGPPVPCVAAFRPDLRDATLPAAAEVPLATDGTRVVAIGPGTRGPFAMAPAVRWPPHVWPVLVEADAQGLDYQWQVLATLVAGDGGGVAAQTVPADSFFDVDTPGDLRDARRRLAR